MRPARASRAAVYCAAVAPLWLPSLAFGSGPTPGSVTPNTLQLPTSPGSVRGLPSDPEFDPFSAQVAYQIPIDAPVFGGSARVALSYSGTTGNGPAGIGWKLSGITVRRTTRLGIPSYSESDELELEGIPSGGGRIFPIGGNEYRVEGRGEDVRVLRLEQGWRVWEPNGMRYEIGVSQSTRQADGDRIAAWWVETATDVAGRTVRYSYTGEGGQVYLAQAIWGPADVYRVDLIYQPRQDVVIDYRLGFRVETRQRISAMEVVSFGEVLRRYDLAYDESFAVSRLREVVQRGRNGQLALPAVTFAYAGPASPVVQRVAGAGTWRLNAQGTSLVDVDADGAADLLQLEAPVVAYRRNRRGTFGQPVLTSGLGTVSLSTSQFLDVDADARVELVYAVGDSWRGFRLEGTEWQPLGIIPGTQGLPSLGPSRQVRFADINADKVSDLITWTNDGIVVRYGQRGSYAPPVQRGRIGGAVLPGEGSDFHDANGDGVADFIDLHADYLLIYLGRGDGQFESPYTIFYPWAGQANVPPADIRLGDLNRDGLMDLVTATLGHVTWYPGRPNFSFAQAVDVPEPGAFSDVVVTVADINGNGSEDVVWSASGGIWRLDMAGPTNAGMLERVDNGLGKVVSFTYESSHSLAVKDEDTTPWSEHLPISIPVVVKEQTALGQGETDRLVDYHVWDGFWDANEHQFGGFLASIVRTWGATPAETSEVRTVYRKGLGSQRALRGKPLNIQLRDGNDVLLTVEEPIWDLLSLPGYPDTPELKLPVQTASTTQHREGGTPRTTRVEYEHDDLGRVVRTTAYGRLDLTGDESVQTTQYADDADLWVRSLPCEEKVEGLDGTLVSHVRHYYGDDENELSLCQCGRGWLRRSEVFLAGEDRWVTQTETSYDSLGHPVKLVQGGVTRRVDYDTLRLHPVAERVELEDNELAWTMEWDNVQGLPLAATDPNGRRTYVEYDSLGRLVGLGLDDRTPHLVVQYDWTEPAPKTIRWEFDGAMEELTPWSGSWSATGHWRQTVEVSNGRGETRYRAVRVADDRWIISDYRERDPNSRVVFVGRPIYASNLQQTTRPAGMVGNQLRYDPLGRLIEQQLPNGAKRTLTYVAFELSARDDELAPVHSVLDGRDRVILTERTLPDGTHEEMDASYDAADRMVRMRLSEGAVVREFKYDSLGRLLEARDPDLGVRTLAWDDAGRLIQEVNGVGQAITYAYDRAGRLTEKRAGASYRYHYDQPRDGAGREASRVAAQLAWIEEPTGTIDVGYDELGRAIFTRRQIDGRVAEETTHYAASGLVLAREYEDGVSLRYQYDPAGRPIGVADMWQVLEQDAAAGVLRERFQNGVEARYERDVLGLISKVTMRDLGGTAIYDVDLTRNGWAGITAINDVDGGGLDHSATFTFDGFARLTDASIGAGDAAYSFAYGYDALHNMVSRTASGPRALGVFAGTYQYAENGKGPRQLTSIALSGTTMHTFDYDAAGRQIRKDQIRLEYNGLDQLLRVSGLTGGIVAHGYGHDGRRLKTLGPDGLKSYFFGEGLAERAGSREHDVIVADRVVARITLPEAVGETAASGGLPSAAGVFAIRTLWTLALVLLGWALFCGLRRLPARRSFATGLASALLASSCSFGPSLGVGQQSVWGPPQVTYFHTGMGAGPTLFTDATGRVLEERRYEPFGEEIDARDLRAGSYELGEPDLVARDLNVLNKRTEVITGWSDHGARWMAPETARWLTPDPPVTGPDPKFLAEPRRLHPYQYVEQNPILFWDPDGKERGLLSSSAANTMCMAQGACTHAEWTYYHDMASGQTPIPVPPDQVSTPAERRAGMHANAVLASYVPMPRPLKFLMEVIVYATEEDRGPIDPSSIDPASIPGPPMPSLGPPAARGGESAAAAAGRRAHENYGTALGDDYDTRVRLPSGKKPDGVNWTKREVRELKPDNPSAVRRGERQVEGYRKELEEVTGEPWTSEVDVYRSGGR